VSGAARLWLFLREAFEPISHFGFVCLWQLSLIGLLALRHHQAGGPPARLTVGGLELAALVAVFLALFVIRAVDEVKDRDYDREFHPDRPLVRGAVSERDLWTWSAGAGALALGLGGLLVPGAGVWPLALLVVELVWVFALVAVERRSAAIRDGLLLNLLVTYPVNLLLIGFAWALFCGLQGVAPDAVDLALAAAHGLVFLHFEFARKLVWPQAARAGQKSYAAALGPGVAAAATLGFAATPLVALAALRPWEAGAAPWALATWGLVVIPLLGAGTVGRFAARRGQEVRLAGGASLTLVLYYVLLLVQAALGVPLALRS